MWDQETARVQHSSGMPLSLSVATHWSCQTPHPPGSASPLNSTITLQLPTAKPLHVGAHLDLGLRSSYTYWLPSFWKNVFFFVVAFFFFFWREPAIADDIYQTLWELIPIWLIGKKETWQNPWSRIIPIKMKGSRIKHMLMPVLLCPGLSLNEAFLSKLDQPPEKQSKYGGCTRWAGQFSLQEAFI